MSDLVAPIPECDGQAQVAPGAGPGHHSHPWEILGSLPEAEQKQFRENFSRLCLPHQRLVFRKLLTRPADIQKFIISEVINNSSYCKHHQNHEVPSLTKKEQKQASTKSGKKNKRRKPKAVKCEIEAQRQKIEALIQKFRKAFMTRQEVWGRGWAA